MRNPAAVVKTEFVGVCAGRRQMHDMVIAIAANFFIDPYFTKISHKPCEWRLMPIRASFGVYVFVIKLLLKFSNKIGEVICVV